MNPPNTPSSMQSESKLPNAAMTSKAGPAPIVIDLGEVVPAIGDDAVDTSSPQATAIDSRPLLHSYKDGSAKLNGYLDDYACLMEGLIDLYQADFDRHWIDEAQALSAYVQDHFADPETGIYYYTSDNHETLISRTKEVQDNATPAAHSVLAGALQRLGTLEGRTDDTRGWDALVAVSGLIADHSRGASQALIALDFALGPTPEVVIVEGGEPDKADQLLATFHRRFVPSYTLSRPSQADGAIASRGLPPATCVTVYICHQGACQAPAVGYDAASLAIRMV